MPLLDVEDHKGEDRIAEKVHLWGNSHALHLFWLKLLVYVRKANGRKNLVTI